MTDDKAKDWAESRAHEIAFNEPDPRHRKRRILATIREAQRKGMEEAARIIEDKEHRGVSSPEQYTYFTGSSFAKYIRAAIDKDKT